MKKLLLTNVIAQLLMLYAVLATEWNDTTCWSAKCHATGDPDGKPKPKDPIDPPPPPP